MVVFPQQDLEEVNAVVGEEVSMVRPVIKYLQQYL